MRAVIGLFVLFMIGKDLAYAPFPYGLRAVAQALCLLVGVYVVCTRLSGGILTRYWPMLGFVAVVLLAAPVSQFPGFVALQALSLASAILFAIAMQETDAATWSARYRTFVMWVIGVYGFVCLVSLLLVRVRPELVIGSLFVGGGVGEEWRFHGLMAKSGIIAAAGGLLFGFAALRPMPKWLRIGCCGVGLGCVALSQSRSFWVGLVVASAVTLWVYFPRWRTAAVAGGSAVVVAASLVMLGKIDSGSFARLDTLSTLNGRTELWQQALTAFERSPLIGYGLTQGSSGMPGNRSANQWTTSSSAPNEFSRETLHNGYLQALLDAGLVGLFFYLATPLVALHRLLRADARREHPELLYVLILLSIANLGESVIYSGSVFQSLCFWMCAVFACGLRTTHAEPAVARTWVAAPANLMK